MFYMSYYQKKIPQKKQVNNIQQDFEFESGNDKKYEFESIWDSVVYIRKLITKQLPEP